MSGDAAENFYNFMHVFIIVFSFFLYGVMTLASLICLYLMHVYQGWKHTTLLLLLICIMPYALANWLYFFF